MGANDHKVHPEPVLHRGGDRREDSQGMRVPNTVAKPNSHPSDENTPTLLAYKQILHQLPRETKTQHMQEASPQTAQPHHTAQPEAQNWSSRS